MCTYVPPRLVLFMLMLAGASLGGCRKSPTKPTPSSAEGGAEPPATLPGEGGENDDPRVDEGSASRPPATAITAMLEAYPVEEMPPDVDCGRTREPCEHIEQDPRVIDTMFQVFAWKLFMGASHRHGQPFWAEPWCSPNESMEVSNTCKNVGDLSAFSPPIWKTLAYNDARPHPEAMPPPPQPIWDQHGHAVTFSTRLNDVACKSYNGDGGLATAAGQLQRTLKRKHPDNWGRWWEAELEDPMPAPVRLRLAWAEIEESKRERYVIDPKDPSLGLVAIHVVARTAKSGNYWVWATFEHEDNLSGPDPLFRAPACEPDCPPANSCPAAQDGVRKTQVEAIAHDFAFPAPHQDYDAAAYRKALGELNAEVQGWLAQQEEVAALAHYRLVGVQRPAYEDLADPHRIHIWPPLLANAILDWDRQETSSCVGCHSRATSWAMSDFGAREVLCTTSAEAPEQCDLRLLTARSECSSGRGYSAEGRDYCLEQLWTPQRFGTNPPTKNSIPEADFFWTIARVPLDLHTLQRRG